MKSKYREQENPGLTAGAYRGYVIGFNHYSGIWYVKKSDAFIGYAKDAADARRIIDELTAPASCSVFDAGPL